MSDDTGRRRVIEITHEMLSAGVSQLCSFDPDYESYADRVNFIVKAALEADGWVVTGASRELLSRLALP